MRELSLLQALQCAAAWPPHQRQPQTRGQLALMSAAQEGLSVPDEASAAGRHRLQQAHILCTGLHWLDLITAIAADKGDADF